VELEVVGDRQVKGCYIHIAHGLRAVADAQVPLVVDVLLVGAGDRSVGQAVDGTDHGGHQAVGVASYRVEAGLAYGRLVDFGKDLTISINLDQIVSELIESIIPIRIIGKGLTVYTKAGNIKNHLGPLLVGQGNGHAPELDIGNGGVRILIKAIPLAQDVIDIHHINRVFRLVEGGLIVLLL